MKGQFIVDDNTLKAHIASSPSATSAEKHPGVVVAHEFPTLTSGSSSTATMSALAEHIATETGFSVLVFAARGMQGCEGNFSLDGWRRDLVGAVDFLADSTDCENIWIIGFGTGGALGIRVAAADGRVRGVASVAAPADFSYWASNPRKILVWGRKVGVIHDEDFPASLNSWAAQLREHNTIESAQKLGDKDLLVIHGNDDELVPVLDARAIASVHPKPELHTIKGAKHHLRHDPRVIAILLGWLERQRDTPHK